MVVKMIKTTAQPVPKRGLVPKVGQVPLAVLVPKVVLVPKTDTTSTENGTGTSTNIGTLNPPIESPNESKNKKSWFCFKKLREEIYLADDSIDFESIMNSKWAEREKRAFEIYNAEKTMSDDLMIYHFADWLINAYRTKYSNNQNPASGKPAGTSPKSQQLSEKQIHTFAQKLSQHP